MSNRRNFINQILMGGTAALAAPFVLPRRRKGVALKAVTCYFDGMLKSEI